MPLQQGSARARQRTVLLVGIAVLLAALVLAVVLASLLTHGRHEVSPQMLKWKDRGTTKNLQEVIVGRCYNYITAQHPELGDKDCLKIWESLKDAFIYKNPCNITPEDYQPLMELASHPIPCNKSLFWSKTNDLVHRYTKSNQNFLTLEDTLLGYMADRVSWCGDPSAPGINYESCPKRNECESNPGSVFWKMASKMFAEAACGVVQVMLNGSVEAGAFRSSSIFGSIEIFNLDPDKVTEVHIWLMQNIGGPQSESCSGQSIQRLINILEERNFKIICEDNYRPVQLLQCVHNPDHTDCRLCTNSSAIP
ncbi:ADP-ribosyl cyclase/cyclic ADP-ribose hydrolase 1-like [Melozone crissalis]|uniref:ADP-ribosyl cyclase/cyclic ADP-ribose hydrolase 1 n=1 Tax=Junco hyemalis TaxID=40217 RepID=A0A8C5JRK9_JUNHY|nr:ADP-ribosyl cyclase/cyclic ADP-ribose hydrolase 1-like [Melozone crissalis]XP_057880555.1 ADP-ribosyl cyclase/cyclic ADP-ribose hydrolase 1-like [Melospiza georgiana]